MLINFDVKSIFAFYLLFHSVHPKLSRLYIYISLAFIKKKNANRCFSEI